ncbi:MAG: UDP-N-acetylmuramate--L-alanine ligase [Eubacteriales bacterium]|nr:UDP-N-acetylmuramate--L-alanine ligase [Eubacteriales bacterium]
MYQIDFKKPCAVHFIGIGGISMSGLAEILLDEGFTVSGSDMKDSELCGHLRQAGAQIAIGQRAENIQNPDVVVYTAAIHPDNPEFAAAKEKGIPMLSRAELLGEMMNNYSEAINIAGTHGKTTTTSMITEILLGAKKDPTVTVGGILDSIGGNIRVGGPDYFVAEACEYTNSFLSFFPTISVILNVEADHLDFFKDIDDIRHSFREFILRLPQNEKGFLVFNGDIDKKEYFLDGLSCGVKTYGHGADCNYRAENIRYDDHAHPSYTLIVDGEEAGEVTLSVTGEHNVYNSLAAIAVADHLGIDRADTKRALSRFSGTERRFEYKGECHGFTVIDDYAHHPQEIAVTIAAAKLYPHKKLWVVFQPHTYSRTKALLPEFAEALSKADEVILADIYAAREKNTIGISSADLAKKMEALGAKVHYIPEFPEIEKFILENLEEGDLLITMGAGNVVDIGNQLISR